MKTKFNNISIFNKKQTYFIADIGANHDGSLSRALKLIRLCAKAGANAAKFQHFKAETIVSDIGFKKLKKLSHQSTWKSSVFETYKKASINPDWTKRLYLECKRYKIDFLTSPYDKEYVDMVNKYIPAYKIGSGDITWLEIIKQIAKKRKPVILATGASNNIDVDRAIKEIIKYNKKIVLMQCNTNYTARKDNINYINLNVLKYFKNKYSDKIILGLSDHTLGHTSVLGAIALGARVIEKHFTDNNYRIGPDHKFAMNFNTWRTMVFESRNLENALGNGVKKIEYNERETVKVQRRSIRAVRNLKKGIKIDKKDIIMLRPCSSKGIPPYLSKKIIGKKITKMILKGDEIIWSKIK
tara:strand:+ start:670 stop:1734 length:1065 start_codon:yes stop_codon:yes gene_type:complete